MEHTFFLHVRCLACVLSWTLLSVLRVARIILFFSSFSFPFLVFASLDPTHFTSIHPSHPSSTTTSTTTATTALTTLLPPPFLSASPPFHLEISLSLPPPLPHSPPSLPFLVHGGYSLFCILILGSLHFIFCPVP